MSRAFVFFFLFAFALNVHAEAKRYLVRFKSQAAFVAAAVSPGGFAAMSSHARVTKTLSHVHLMVLESDDALSLQFLLSHPDVERIEEEVIYPLPGPLRTFAVTGAPALGATPVPRPWGISAVKAPEAWTYTRGRGARVLVLDTGVDTGHEALAGQIEAVQNFNGGDPKDVTDQVGHGTHVSGTILANGLNNGLIGVAPEAKLLMGKVCDEKGCGSAGIASGLDWAIEEKVDVVNMSLGGTAMGLSESEAVMEAENAGVMIVAATGNDGKPLVAFPGAEPTVLAVGAVDQTLAKASFSNWGPQLGVVGPGVAIVSSVPRGTGRAGVAALDLADGQGLVTVDNQMLAGSPQFGPVTVPLVFANLGSPQDFTGLDIKGKIALIARGEIAFKDKVANAAAAGALGVILFNNAPGLVAGIITSDGTPTGANAAIPAVMIEQQAGAAAQTAIQAGRAVQVQMGIVGTDFDLHDGTSMATPHVTGVALLVRAANKALTPAEVRAILKQTATPLSPNDQNQLGAGLVNAQKAVIQAVTAIPQF